MASARGWRRAPGDSSSPPGVRAAASASRPERTSGATASGSRTSGDVPLVRLAKRREFVAAARGARWVTEAFVLQCVARPERQDAGFGFTATRKLGGAVVRNRAKRRLREAVRLTAPLAAVPGHDYVVVARAGALSCPFDKLLLLMCEAITRCSAKLVRDSRTESPARSSSC